MPVSSLRCTSPTFDVVGLSPFFGHLHMFRRHQLGFQLVGVHCLKGGWVRVEHKDSRTNAGLAQHDAFVGIRHGEPVDVLAFQQPAKQHGIGAIAQALDHRDDALCSGVSLQRTQVVDQGAGVGEGQGGDMSRRCEACMAGCKRSVEATLTRRWRCPEPWLQSRAHPCFETHESRLARLKARLAQLQAWHFSIKTPTRSPNPQVTEAMVFRPTRQGAGPVGMHQSALRHIANQSHRPTSVWSSIERTQATRKEPKSWLQSSWINTPPQRAGVEDRRPDNWSSRPCSRPRRPASRRGGGPPERRCMRFGRCHVCEDNRGFCGRSFQWESAWVTCQNEPASRHDALVGRRRSPKSRWRRRVAVHMHL